MANIIVTASTVRPLSGASIRRFDAGGAVSVGDAVYVASDGDVEGAEGGGAVTSAWAIGVVAACPDGATGAVAGEAVDVVVHGSIEFTTGLTPGTLIYVGDSTGMVSTVAATESCVLGFVESATQIFVRPQIISFA